MKRTRLTLLTAFAVVSLGATGAHAQKPTLSTKDPVKSQVRVKTDPIKADVKLPGTTKVTAKGRKTK
jgi:hypothetical protein